MDTVYDIIYFIIVLLVIFVITALLLALSGISLYNTEQKARGENTNQSFWTKVARWWRAGGPIIYPYRRMLYNELCSMGVEASIAELGRREEKTGKGSLGIIDIAGRPISWINVRLIGSGDDSEDFVDYGVNDSRPLPRVEIESKWVKTSPIVGHITDVRWEGEDRDTGIIQLLNNNDKIKYAIMGTCLVAIRTCPEYGCWLIVQRRYTWNPPLIQEYQWRCYEDIARILLSTSLTERE